MSSGENSLVKKYQPFSKNDRLLFHALDGSFLIAGPNDPLQGKPASYLKVTSPIELEHACDIIAQSFRQDIFIGPLARLTVKAGIDAHSTWPLSQLNEGFFLIYTYTHAAAIVRQEIDRVKEAHDKIYAIHKGRIRRP